MQSISATGGYFFVFKLRKNSPVSGEVPINRLGNVARSFAGPCVWAVISFFFVFAAVLSVARPLCCADDASFAVVSKNLAHGLGYLLTLNYAGTDFSGSLFDPRLGTGPTSIILAAVAIFLFGAAAAIPGLSHVVLNAAIVLAIGRLLRPLCGREAALAALGVFLALVVATGAFHFEHWFAQLGEVLAALLVILGVAVWSLSKTSQKGAAIAGLLMGLAFQSKHLAVFYAIPMEIICLWSVIVAPPRERFLLLARGLLFTVAFLVPFLAFEVWKLVVLGISGWLANWHEFLAFLLSQGVAGGEPNSVAELVNSRLHALSERFFLLPIPTALIVISTIFGIKSMSPPLRILCTVLTGGVGLHLVYWTFASVGWPRYFYIGLVVACFVTAVVVIETSSKLWKILAITAMALTIAYGLPRMAYQWNLLVEARTHPQGTFNSATLIASVIDRESPTRPVLSQWWAHVAALEYLSSKPARYVGWSGGTDEPTVGRLLVVNERYLNRDDASFMQLLRRCDEVLVRSPPYWLHRCRS